MQLTKSYHGLALNIFIIIILILVSSVGVSVLVYPCHSVLYYFSWGVILRICFNLEIMQNEKNQ